MSILVLTGLGQKDGGTVMGSGSGTFPILGGTRVGRELYVWDLARHQLCTVANTYDKRAYEMVGKLPPGVILFRPDAPLPGYPHGFGGDVTVPEKLHNVWRNQQEKLYRRAAHLSASKGGAMGLNTIYATSGGHLPMVYGDVDNARKYFSSAKNLVIYPLPTNDPLLWRNLQLPRYKNYPDDLNMPVMIADNRFHIRLDRTLPAMHTIFFSGERIAGNRTMLEMFGSLCQQYTHFGLAESHRDLPVVDLNIWQKLRGYQPCLRSEDVFNGAAEVLYQVLQPEANISPCPHPDPSIPSFVALAGMPVPQDRRMSKEERSQFVADVLSQVKEMMAQQGQAFPNSLYTVWSDKAHGTKDQFIRFQAVRVYPIVNYTARDMIDAMISGKTI